MISGAEARHAHTHGQHIGRTSPTDETKGTHWEVVHHEGKIIACSLSPWGTVGYGMVIRERDLPAYCDDPTVARWAIENNADVWTHPACLAGQVAQ